MFLEEISIPQDQIDQICRVINAVSFSKNRGKHPETLEGKIVQDADRLDAIGAVGIARTFFLWWLQREVPHWYRPTFPWQVASLKDEMNTETAKQMAENRHQF